MMDEALITQALAAVFALAAALAALAALQVRALFATAMGLAGASACAAAALVALGAGEGALAIALFGGALAPVMLLAGVLLSARAAKALPRKPIWFGIGAAALLGALLMWAAPELAAAPAPPAPQAVIGPWIAAIVFVAGLGVAALIGFGERGPFSGPRP